MCQVTHTRNSPNAFNAPSRWHQNFSASTLRFMTRKAVQLLLCYLTKLNNAEQIAVETEDGKQFSMRTHGLPFEILI